MAKYKITASTLYVRSGPGTSYKTVGTLKQNTIVDVLSTKNGWHNIGTNRWISGTYATKVVEETSSSTNKSTGIAPSLKTTEEGRPIYLMQSDSRWGSRLYTVTNDKTQTIKSSACGPTCMAMLINTYIDNTYSPVEACEWSIKNGYRTANNGTSWGLFKAAAVKYGFKFLQTASIDEAYKFMKANPNAHTVCIMTKGLWTTGGHYILCWKMDDTYVYVNDPISTKAEKQKNTKKLLASQCRQYFCFSYDATGKESTGWAATNMVIPVVPNRKMAVAAESLNVRSGYSTEGTRVLGVITEGCLVTATKKCGDWYYVISEDPKLEGWVAANYVEDANLNNVNSGLAKDTKEAIEYLTKIGFMNSPDWWINNAFQVNYATNLLIKIANRVKSEEDQIDNKKFAYSIDGLDKATKSLNSLKVIDSPDMWKNNGQTDNKLNNIGYLLIKAANYID